MPSVVITGGGSGTGKAAAQLLLGKGLDVTILATDAPDWTHDRLTVVVGDASDPSDVARAADAAQGQLVGWVNASTVSQNAPLHERPDAALEAIAATLVPAVVGTAEAVRRFLGSGSRGAIVNVSSFLAQRPEPGTLASAVALSAVEGLTRATAAEYGGAGIRANAVALGATGDGAEVIAWLLSNPASSITGAVLPAG